MWEQVATGTPEDNYAASLATLEANTRYRLRFALTGLSGDQLDSIASALRPALAGFLPAGFTLAIEGDEVVAYWTQEAT